MLAYPLAADALGGAIPAEVALTAVGAQALPPHAARLALHPRRSVRAGLVTDALLAHRLLPSVLAHEPAGTPHALDDRDLVLAKTRLAAPDAVVLPFPVRASHALFAPATRLHSVLARTFHGSLAPEERPRLRGWPVLGVRTRRGWARRLYRRPGSPGLGRGFLRDGPSRPGLGLRRNLLRLHGDFRRRRFRRRRGLGPGFPRPEAGGGSRELSRRAIRILVGFARGWRRSGPPRFGPRRRRVRRELSRRARG